jgi:hypothetical protein
MDTIAGKRVYQTARESLSQNPPDAGDCAD